MGFLDRNDVPECDALHRIGVVTAVNDLSRTLDVTIGGTPHADVAVHYH